MFKKSFVYQGRGQIIKDKLEDETRVELVLVENMPSIGGDFNKSTDIKINNKDSNGRYYVNTVTQSKSITARWINIYNSNRVSAPDVTIGEYVDVFKYGGADEYYWASLSTNMRKREKVVYAFSNMRASNPSGKNTKAYTFIVDTINKEISLNTDDSDGESSLYNFILDTKDGIFTIKDKQGNYFNLESTVGDGTCSIKINKLSQMKGTDLVRDFSNSINSTTNTKIDNNYIYISNTGNKFIINTPLFGVFGNGEELIALLLEFIQACADEKHIGNLGVLTNIDGGSRAKFMDIKNRLAKFKTGGDTTPAIRYNEP